MDVTVVRWACRRWGCRARGAGTVNAALGARRCNPDAAALRFQCCGASTDATGTSVIVIIADTTRLVLPTASSVARVESRRAREADAPGQVGRASQVPSLARGAFAGDEVQIVSTAAIRAAPPTATDVCLREAHATDLPKAPSEKAVAIRRAR